MQFFLLIVKRAFGGEINGRSGTVVIKDFGSLPNDVQSPKRGLTGIA